MRTARRRRDTQWPMVRHGRGGFPGGDDSQPGGGSVGVTDVSRRATTNCAAMACARPNIRYYVFSSRFGEVRQRDLGGLTSLDETTLTRDVSTWVMGQFPLILIPTFFVPLLLIFHLINPILKTRPVFPLSPASSSRCRAWLEAAFVKNQFQRYDYWPEVTWAGRGASDDISHEKQSVNHYNSNTNP